MRIKPTHQHPTVRHHPAAPVRASEARPDSFEGLVARVATWLKKYAASSAPAANPSLAPTPIRKGDAPGQVTYVNTIANGKIAPKSSYRNDVNGAIDAVREKRIGLDSNDPDHIVDYDAFHNAVVTELRSRGFNAAYDGEELAINRPGDDHSEQFDISTSTMRVRRFYAAWLSPPVFEGA